MTRFKGLTRGLRHVLVAAGAAAAVVGTSSSVLAFDWKHLPGSACIIEQSTQLLNYGEYAWYSTTTGGIIVSGFGTVPWNIPARLNCPVLRDVFQNTNGVADLKVHVSDINSGKQISCWGHSTTEAGVMIQQVGPVKSGVSFNGGYKQLVVSPTLSHHWSRYNVVCDVEPAPGMEVQGIGWAEHNGDGW